jgi:hypothetical protein
MPNETPPMDAPQPESTVSPVAVEIGDAVELTEGTSSRSGSEDKRYKYQ